jgi:hypothetical protein
MTRESIATLAGLALLAVAACQGGGSPNDFGAPSDENAPTAPGAPEDPNAPPANTTDPPFGDVAPPPNDQPPGGDCFSLCNESRAACEPGAGAEDFADCVEDCGQFPTGCFPALRRFLACAIANDCEIDDSAVCERETLDVIACVGPQSPPSGEGGRGGN